MTFKYHTTGAHVRAAEKDKRLWNAWNELDWKEVNLPQPTHPVRLLPLPSTSLKLLPARVHVTI
jgi:hypothetical protein